VGRTPVTDTEGSFISTCGFSHRGPDDPIVLPGRPGRSHDHSFVGNVSTDAFSTLSSLRKAATTCDRGGDTAAYWAPTLFVDGKPLTPAGAAVYYRRLTASRVQPFPTGLRMVAGNSLAGSAQSLSVVFWDCGLVKTTLYGRMLREQGPVPTAPAAASSKALLCPPGSKLQMHINFPDCWNGKSLDSFDHRRHMAYSVGGACPRGHPVAVPALSLVYQYPVPTGVVALSSGSVYSAHADFVNAWNQEALAKLVNWCLNALRPCGIGSG